MLVELNFSFFVFLLLLFAVLRSSIVGVVIASLILFAIIVSTCSIYGGGGGASGGGLFLHTFGCAYFKFFINMVLLHKLHVPVFAAGSSALATLRSSCLSIFICSKISSATASGITTGSFGGSSCGTSISLGISVIGFASATTILFETSTTSIFLAFLYILY